MVSPEVFLIFLLTKTISDLKSLFSIGVSDYKLGT